jgi:GT2 family glycosyltransferase
LASLLFGEYELLAMSGLFDAEYYIGANPDIADLNVDPLMHYLEKGCREGRNPSAHFDTSHYLNQCKALGDIPSNALHHYLTVGVKRGLTPTYNVGPNGRKAGSKGAPRITPDKQPQPLNISGKGVYDLPDGYIDIFGYSSAAGGWLFNGWVPRPPRVDQTDPVELVAQYEQSQIKGRATLAYYQRGDLDHKSVGVIAFLPNSSRVLGNLQHLAFALDGVEYRARSSDRVLWLHDQELVDRIRPTLTHQAFINRCRDHLLSITSRRGFTGQDTLSALSEPVFLGIDDAVSCPPAGVLLKGWYLSAPGTVRSIRVRSGPLSGELVIADSLCVARPDVIAAVDQKLGFSDVGCGFVAYVPNVISHRDAGYIEVELENGEIGFKCFQLSKRSGIDAIKRVLEGIDVRYGELDRAFDRVLGPTVTSINSARLSKPAVAAETEFGRAPVSPKCSLIVPLYGRVDFVEYQMALFSEHGEMADVEIIYVLDDPTKRRELEVLAQSVFERFRIPFRLLLLPANLGFAPANNVGLRAARGRFICFLNSDIFPITERWLECLMERLECNPDIGIIGAQLLFEDGSIQHEGCFYRSIREFGDWTFIEHRNKWRRPSDIRGLQRRDVITGACMVMDRSLALELQGFDEAFVVGDFEDSDLCLKVKARGLSCAVDHDVQLYHLERKSQADPSQSWRMNLTLYNAWVHQRRWFDQSKSGQALPPKMT